VHSAATVAFDSPLDAAVEVNLLGVLYGMRAFLPEMLRTGRGHIVNVASLAGRFATPGTGLYSATKHAVVGLCEAVRAETRDTGIEVSCVMPVPVNTGLMEGVADQRAVKRVEPEDVANEIVAALELQRFDVFVPRYMKTTVAVGNILPRKAREAMARFMGVDKILTEVDRSKRRAYEERAAASAAAGGEEDKPVEVEREAA